jgi:AraC-like DNA-binding protein
MGTGNSDIVITDISEWDQAVSVRRCKAIQLDAGAANICLYRRTFGETVVEGGRFGTRIRSQGTSPPGHVTVGVVYNAGLFTRFNDTEAKTGDILFFGPEASYEAAGGCDLEFFGISFPVDRFVDYIRICHGADVSDLISGFNHVDLPSVTSTLCTWWNKCRNFRPAALSVGGSTVEEKFLSAVGSTLETTIRPPNLCVGRRREIALAAEDYFRANQATDPAVYSICKALGVPRRTLEYAFLEVFGLSPSAYFHRVKLNEAHRRLKEIKPERGAVKQVAYECGFSNLGNFAIQYREFFGVVPTQTLYSGSLDGSVR